MISPSHLIPDKGDNIYGNNGELGAGQTGLCAQKQYKQKKPSKSVDFKGSLSTDPVLQFLIVFSGQLFLKLHANSIRRLMPGRY